MVSWVTSGIFYRRADLWWILEILPTKTFTPGIPLLGHPSKGSQLIFGAIPSILPIILVSPLRLGAVERSPRYTLPLNAEPPTSQNDDRRLSAGCRLAEPARGAFSLEGQCSFAQLRAQSTHTEPNGRCFLTTL